jgi:two-component sensor histidine kinase
VPTNLRTDFSSTEFDQQAQSCGWLSALHEPAALVRTSGDIVEGNRAFRRKFAEVASGRHLSEFLTDPPERIKQYLLACSASGEPLLGAVHPVDGHRSTCRGSRVSLDGEVLVLLRLFEPDERFVRLTTTIKQLNDLLRQREHEKAQLQEALNDRDVLHRELQHRVKNNLQMLSGLLHAAKTDHENEAAKAALDEAFRRFSAVAAAHQSLYQLDSLRTVPAEPLISQIANAAALASDREVQIVCSIDEIRLPNDLCTPLALIVNELVTNALKHARIKSGPLKVEVRFSASAGAALLEVHDNGSGFHAPSVWKRGSGIGLVKGLVRQLRGKLTIDPQEGTLFTVSFPLRQAE